MPFRRLAKRWRGGRRRERDLAVYLAQARGVSTQTIGNIVRRRERVDEPKLSRPWLFQGGK